MMADEIELHCSFGDCASEAAVYCSVCSLLLCGAHQTNHDELYKKAIKSHTVISVRKYSINRGENSPFCRVHDKRQITLACTQCYQPLCPECIDDTAITNGCGQSGQDKHITRNVERVANQIGDELDELLSALRVKEMTDSEDVKTRRAIYDDQMKKSRDGLNKLDKKIQEQREIFEELARSNRQKIVDSMNEREEVMQKWEQLYENHQNMSKQMRGRVSKFNKLNKEAIVKNQRQIKEGLHVQIQSKLEEGPHLPKQLFVQVLDKPVEIPVRLRESPSTIPTIPILLIPTQFSYRESRTAQDKAYCVHFTKEGQLLHAGHNYIISDFSLTTNIPTDDNRSNFSICEHNNHLYIMQCRYDHNQYYIHKINLSDQSVSENIINFKVTDCYSLHVVVNDEFIIISDRAATCVRIYSSENFAHLFNIEHECISGYARGVGLLGDTLVVGDYYKNQVSNITINETPEVQWICTGITDPTGLRVVDNPQMILVASYTAKIYILSHQGEKLSTLDVPECSKYIYDIAVYGDKIAIADYSKQVKLYEMKVEK